MELPKKVWFKIENPIKMDDLGVPNHKLETYYIV